MTKIISEQIGNAVGYILLTIVVVDSFFVYATYRTTRAVTENMQNSVIEEQVFSDLKDAECGQRGFLYTDGDESYLPQYYVGVASTKADMIILKEYLKSQPDSAAVVRQLDTEINIKLTEMDSTVRVFRGGDPPKAKAIVITGNGMRDMDRIRTLIGVLRAQERDNLRHRRSIFG